VRPMFSGVRSLSDQPGPVAETAPPPQDYEQVAVRASLLPPAPVPSEPPAANAYPLDRARRDLEAAKSRDRVVDVLLEFASQFFEYTAVFAIVSDEARGLKSIGVGTGTDALRALKIPLDLQSPLR